MNVEMNIEELVLHGFPPGDRHRIGEALENELSRLFVQRGVPSSLKENRRIESLGGGAFEVRPGAGPGETGVRVARIVYERIGNPRDQGGTRS